MLFHIHVLAQAQPSTEPNYIPVIAAAISVVASVGVVLLTYILNRSNFEKTQKLSRETLEETKRQNRATARVSHLSKKRERIERALVEFYVPLHAYLQVTEALGHLVKIGKPAKFRILPHLFDTTQEYQTENGTLTRIDLESSDMNIIHEIINIEKEIEEIISSKAGLVDDPSFIFDYAPSGKSSQFKPELEIGLIPHLVAHFRVLRMAIEGNLSGQASRFKDFAFPRQLKEELKTRIQALQKELEQLDSEAGNPDMVLKA